MTTKTERALKKAADIEAGGDCARVVEELLNGDVSIYLSKGAYYVAVHSERTGTPTTILSVVCPEYGDLYGAPRTKVRVIEPQPGRRVTVDRARTWLFGTPAEKARVAKALEEER